MLRKMKTTWEVGRYYHFSYFRNIVRVVKKITLPKYGMKKCEKDKNKLEIVDLLH